jgi:chromosome segregation ATPase
LCYFSQNTPALVQRLRELNANTKRDSAASEFITTFTRLRKLTHTKLRTAAEEEREMKLQLQELIVQTEEDRNRLMELSDRLEVERTEHKQTIAAKDNKIKRLKNQIKQVKQSSELKRKEFEQTMRDQAEVATTVFKQTEKDLMKHFEKIKANLDLEGSENWRAELQQHRKMHQQALNVETQIQKYDTDVSEKYESIVDLQVTSKHVSVFYFLPRGRSQS